jgi:hypothetical protein
MILLYNFKMKQYLLSNNLHHIRNIFVFLLCIILFEFCFLLIIAFTTFNLFFIEEFVRNKLERVISIKLTFEIS